MKWMICFGVMGMETNQNHSLNGAMGNSLNFNLRVSIPSTFLIVFHSHSKQIKS